MKIILFRPQIPQNTGNIARTCSVTGSELLLVRPLGFSTANRHLKRAGLDYWNDLSVQEIDDLELYLEERASPFFFFSSKAKRCYTSAFYSSDSVLVFGSEETGLPQELFHKWPEHFYRIPMKAGARCLNLACSAAIVLYEAMRQTSFERMNREERERD